MQRRTQGWILVWIVLGLAGVLAYPTGQSSLVFGFWPSNHFRMWVLTLIVAIVGVVYAYDMLYNVYPNSEAYDDLEPAGGE